MRSLPTKRHCLLSCTKYLIVTLLVLCITPWIGSEKLDAEQVLSDLTHSAEYHIDTKILIDQRLPRTILAFLVGASLALTGSVFQVILRNPLATPYTLGVTGGGTVGAYLAITFSSLSFRLGPLTSTQCFALLGSSLTLFFIYSLAKRKTTTSIFTLLLTGVTIGIFCSAIILLLSYFASPNKLVAMNRWTMGGVDVIGYGELSALLPLLIPGLVLLFMQTPSLNHIALGQEMAMGHGVDVHTLQRNVFIAGGLTTAAVVSLAGPIGFVGLIIPHIVRQLSGFDHRIILPSTFLLGGAFLVVCDTIARTILAPTEMPVGIITAVTGSPFFIHLLLKNKQANY